MNDQFSDFYMKRYGEEELNEDDINLIHDSFWSSIRASLFKKIAKGTGGQTQWAYIVGKRSRHIDGQRIKFSRKVEKHLWAMVEYLNSEEGLDELMDHGINKAPEHIDDLVDIIANAKTDRDIKRDQFRLFLKHKHKIMKFLLG